jgi:uncharacterized membrane protein YozB (DUF420 family)
MQTTICLLILVVMAFIVVRMTIDLGNLRTGSVPAPGDFNHRYALHPVLAYAHVVPAAIYLLGAPVQLSRRFRTRHPAVHRRMGRVVLPVGLIAGVFAVVFGMLYSYGGVSQAIGTVLFGCSFLSALITAYLAVRRGDITAHRRWMIRAFALGLAVGTFRLWVIVFQTLGLLSLQNSFAVAVWLSFPLHALAAEVYLRRWPSAHGALRRGRPA